MLRNSLDTAKIRGDGFSGSPSIEFKDSMEVKQGILEILVWRGPANSKLVKRIYDDNLVVTMARKMMSRLISGAAGVGVTIQTIGGPVSITNPNQLYITNMRWGTGGHNPSDPTQPIPPSVSDENLAIPIVSPAQKAVTVDYPTVTSVRFTAELDQTEANGLGLSEEGIFSDINLMFARKTFGLLTKTADFTFQFRHTILF